MRTQVKFWTTPKAHRLFADLAERHGIHRSYLIGETLHAALVRDLGEVANLDTLFPRYVPSTGKRVRDSSLGHGRWGRWVQGVFTAHSSVPMLLTRAAEATGDNSGSAYIRRILAERIERDLGVKVDLPATERAEPFQPA